MFIQVPVGIIGEIKKYKKMEYIFSNTQTSMAYFRGIGEEDWASGCSVAGAGQRPQMMRRWRSCAFSMSPTRSCTSFGVDSRQSLAVEGGGGGTGGMQNALMQ